MLRILEDRAEFPDSYSAWVDSTQQRMHELAVGGGAVYRQDVDPDELADAVVLTTGVLITSRVQLSLLQRLKNGWTPQRHGV